MANYRINENFMDELQKKLARIERKCRKLDCAYKFEEIGEEFETTKDENGKEITTRFVLVDVEGTAIINDWEYVASIDKTENGNIIDKALVDIEVPRRYWTSSLYCEHCNTHRARSHAYLVHNTKTGEFKQIGRQCLAEYTHGLSAEYVAAFMELKRVCEEAEESYDGCGHSGWKMWYKSEEVLSLTFGAVRSFGYAPSSEPDSTKQKVCEYITCIRKDYHRDMRKYFWKIEDEMKAHNISMTNEKDLEEARKALAWLKDQEEKSDYMHNLKTAIGDQTEAGRLGLLISLVPTYCKAIERELQIKEREAAKEQEKKVAKHVGNVGDRITFTIASCGVLTAWHNDFGGYYGGYVYLYKLTDKKGNVYIWKTSTDLEESCIGKEIKGTIKEHGEFNGVKQNVITRCKVQW